MSVFRGYVAEYPGVIIDHFVPSNCERGRAFFLSHCHRDHMTGLGSPAIVHALKARQTSFHCSEVTHVLLLNDPEFSDLAPYLKALPMEQPVAMMMDALSDLSPLSFTVTLLPAGHCPGSVMFFFQGPGGNVLYTGDFRLTLEETKRLRPLHSSKRVVDISSLYLDTTFCHPAATKLPSRETSRDKVLEIVESWLAKDKCNVVRLHCASFGYEHILMGVAKRCRTKVHIARWKIEAYADLPAVADCLTSDGNSTRIHCCIFRRGVPKDGQLPCGSCPVPGKKPPNVLHIKPSTLWFLSATRSLSDPFVFLPKYNSYRVIHSMHASYEELCQFVCYLKPSRIVPCVVPVGDSSFTNVHTRLKLLLPQAEVDASACIISAGSDDGGKGTRQKRDKLKKGEASRKRLSMEEKQDSSWMTAKEGSDSRLFMTSQKHSWEENDEKLRSFSSHTASVVTDESHLLLPSMLAASGGVIAPPRYLRGMDAAVAEGSLEQSPLDLYIDSSEEDPSKCVTPTKCERPAKVLSLRSKSSKLSFSSTLGQRPKISAVPSACDQVPLSKKAKVHYKSTPMSVKAHSSGQERNDHHTPEKDHQHTPERDYTSNQDHHTSKQDHILNKDHTPAQSEDHHSFSSKCNNNFYKETSTCMYFDSHHHQKGDSKSSCSLQPLGRSRSSSCSPQPLGRSRSPSVLPLTPGREDVESIFLKKNLALF